MKKKGLIALVTAMALCFAAVSCAQNVGETGAQNTSSETKKVFPAVITTAGEYDASKTSFEKDDVIVKVSGVIIKNATLNSITVDEAVADGDFTLENSKVSKFVVKGGGSNSIHVKSTIVVEVEVSKEGVRIALEGTTKVTKVEVKVVCALDSDSTEAVIAKVNVVSGVEKVTLKGKVNVEDVEAASSEFKLGVESNDVQIASATAGGGQVTVEPAEGVTVAPISTLPKNGLPVSVGVNELAGRILKEKSLKDDGTGFNERSTYTFDESKNECVQTFEIVESPWTYIYTYSYDSNEKMVYLKLKTVNGTISGNNFSCSSFEELYNYILTQMTLTEVQKQEEKEYCIGLFEIIGYKYELEESNSGSMYQYIYSGSSAPIQQIRLRFFDGTKNMQLTAGNQGFNGFTLGSYTGSSYPRFCFKVKNNPDYKTFTGYVTYEKQYGEYVNVGTCDGTCETSINSNGKTQDLKVKFTSINVDSSKIPETDRTDAETLLGKLETNTVYLLGKNQ